LADTDWRIRKVWQLNTALHIAQVIVSVLLIIVLLTQAKGSGFSGSFSGDSSSIYRTRRGIEKTLFNFTIGTAVVFVVLSIVATLVL
jgi:preprotein translocase subunit SecG